MLPTPSTSHVSFDNIYEPAEDSYLLLDTLSSASETAFLTQRFPQDSPAPLVTEIGVGSGVVLAFTAANSSTIFGRSDIAFLGTDVNPLAAKAAAQTVETAVHDKSAARPAVLRTIVSDLTSAIRDQEIDVLVFNPPYVPSPSLPRHLEDFDAGQTLDSHARFERNSKLLELSYAGGADGMETTNRLLEQLPRTLSERGVAYILLCAQNKPEEVKARIRSWPGGWSAETVGSSGKKAGWERLCIIRVWRSGSETV